MLPLVDVADVYSDDLLEVTHARFLARSPARLGTGRPRTRLFFPPTGRTPRLGRFVLTSRSCGSHGFALVCPVPTLGS